MTASAHDAADEAMRRRWRVRFAAVVDALEHDDEADALDLLRKALRRRRGPADVAAIVRWVFATHIEEPVGPGERSLVDDLVGACLLAFPAETTGALTAGLAASGPPWLITLLGSSTHAGVGHALVDAIDMTALDEPGLVVFVEALHQRAGGANDDDARAFLAAMAEEPLPRKAKGALRSARFRLGLG